ncbi:MAG: hypothetical protein ABG776_21265 [Cyanobacteria bacterium J06555_13]
MVSKQKTKVPPTQQFHHQFRIASSRSDVRWLAHCITQWRYGQGL